MSYPTSRRHPRTLAQAWPREHACPIEYYPEPLAKRIARAAICIAAAAAIGAMLALGSRA